MFFSDLHSLECAFPVTLVLPNRNNMKAILTLFTVLLFGAMALAQNTTTNVKVEVFKMDVVLVDSLVVPFADNQVTPTTENRVARLYKFKNSRVKKALAFTTKRNKARLA